MKKRQKKNFIKRIQASSAVVRQRWLWFLTAVSGLVVILMWSLYINLTVEKINDRRPRQHTFSQIWSAGFQSVKRNINQGLDIVLGSKTITLNQPERKFVYEKMEKKEIVKLP